jgi:hypothetical protein
VSGLVPVSVAVPVSGLVPVAEAVPVSGLVPVAEAVPVSGLVPVAMAKPSQPPGGSVPSAPLVVGGAVSGVVVLGSGDGVAVGVTEGVAVTGGNVLDDEMTGGVLARGWMTAGGGLFVTL